MRKDKKGFTLIELLAVIIILGILMLVAVPAVSAYITNSRKSAYVSTAKAIMKGTMNLANDGTLDLTSTETTYYIPASCVDVDNTTKSPYGDFVKAYTVIGFDGESFSYYWLSVDDTGMGVTDLVSNETISTNDIVSGIDSEEMDTDFNIPSKSKIMVYNGDCTASRQDKSVYEATFKSGIGTFDDGTTENVLYFPKKDKSEVQTITKYSHTQNISDDGTQNSNYGDYWDNSYITGTDRGDTSKAHVVSIPGAPSLHVSITYGGEQKRYDWLCVWKGSRPNAITNYANSECESTDILGGGKIGPETSDLPKGTVEFDVEGDTVTFGYRTDSSSNGNNSSSRGYGYYAVVTADVKENAFTGTYKIPSINGYTFEGWIDDATNQKITSIYSLGLSEDKSYTAAFKGFARLTINSNGQNTFVDGTNLGSGPSFIKDTGSTMEIRFEKTKNTTFGYDYWYITYDSDGGNTTPGQQSCQKIKDGTYTFNYFAKSSGCGENPFTYTDQSNDTKIVHVMTFTFPTTPGATCAITPMYNSTTTSDYYARSKTLAGAPTKEGYTFAGWKSSIDNQIYEAGASYTPTGDVTMTAQWTPVG